MIESKQDGFQITDNKSIYELIRDLAEETFYNLMQFQETLKNLERTLYRKTNSIPRIELLLKCGLHFPFLNKALSILQGILPEAELTPEEELLFVLRAYGKTITGQNIQIEKVLQNEDFSFDAFLDSGSSKDMKDQFSRKLVAINEFNTWLKDNGFAIEVKPKP